MNTLSRAITARLFPSQTHYERLVAQWSVLVNSPARHELTGAHHLLYLALLGRDWRKAFTLPSNPIRLANGAYENWGFFHAWHGLHSEQRTSELLAPFGELVTPTMLANLRLLLPYKLIFRYKRSDYRPGSFPFEAYTWPEAWLSPQGEVNNA